MTSTIRKERTTSGYRLCEMQTRGVKNFADVICSRPLTSIVNVERRKERGAKFLVCKREIGVTRAKKYQDHDCRMCG